MMNIQLTLFFLLVPFSLHLKAQTETPVINQHRESEIGISGGIHKSGFYGRKDDFVECKPFPSYMTSVYYKVPIFTKLYMGFELEYMNVKSNLIFSDSFRAIKSSITYDELFDLDYVNLHFLFGGKLFFIKNAVISGTLSPYIGYLLRSEARGQEIFNSTYSYGDSIGLHSGYSQVQFDVHEIPSAKLRDMNSGIGMSLDVAIPIDKKLSLVLKTAYNIGIYSVTKRNIAQENLVIRIRGYVFSVGAVYKLHQQNEK